MRATVCSDVGSVTEMLRNLKILLAVLMNLNESFIWNQLV